MGLGLGLGLGLGVRVGVAVGVRVRVPRRAPPPLQALRATKRPAPHAAAPYCSHCCSRCCSRHMCAARCSPTAAPRRVASATRRGSTPPCCYLGRNGTLAITSIGGLGRHCTLVITPLPSWGATVRGAYSTPEAAGTCTAYAQKRPARASCPVPSVRTARGRLVRVARTYSTAPGRGCTCQLRG